MILKLLVTTLLILTLLVGWLAVQFMARRHASLHPELGPFREEGGGCGSHCRCDHHESCHHKKS
ncbi:MAG: chemotaxis protein [Gammaproteobacteria bacterium]|nr:chemotaxis protein [Gammaproteobacteria bacterium]